LSERKPHLSIDRFARDESYRPTSRVIPKSVRQTDRTPHGQALLRQYETVQRKFDELRTAQLETISEHRGVYVEITGKPGKNLKLESLDNQSSWLSSSKFVDGKQVAVIFIRESKRREFAKKVEQYLDVNQDGKGGPKNFPLLDNIDSIKLANLRSLFTDDSSTFPEDSSDSMWWEVWLKPSESDEDNYESIISALCERIGAQLGKTRLSFFGSEVVLVKASQDQLESSLTFLRSE